MSKHSDFLDLPTPPTSWAELTGEQVEEIHAIANRSNSDEDYKMHVFFYLTGLRMVCKIDSNTLMLQHGNEQAPMNSEEIKYWIDKFMKFLDSSFELYQNPYPDGIWVGRQHFKTPDAVCSSITWQQAGEVQRAMQGWWEADERVRSLQSKVDEWMRFQEYYSPDYSIVTKGELDPRTATQIREAVEERRTFRNTFLCHLLVPKKYEPFRKIREWMGYYFTSQYKYDFEIAEQLMPVVDKIPDSVFLVLYQQFQSALNYYHRAYPDLFRQKKKKRTTRTKDELVTECDMIEGIKKYAGYPKEDDVYDALFPLVLSILNTISIEQKMIDEQNANINSK